MGKEAYYFSHDSNAKDDPKCVQLIEDLGLEGYGIFWMLIETLRDQPTYRYPIKLIPSLARRYNTTTPKVEVVVKNYNLFEVQNDDFFSLSLNKRMEQKEAKSLKAKESANQRWKQLHSDGNANALETHNDGNAIKESKGNESKLNEINLLPAKADRPKSFKQYSEEEFKNEVAMFKDLYPSEMLRKFYLYWIEKSPNGKMKFQLNKTWETKLRLVTWKNNNFDSGKTQPVPEKLKTTPTTRNIL
jgi:hypothetical protein